MNIIGITGAAGAGKDTLAELIGVDGWVRFAYADALKQICIDYLGLSYDDAYTQNGKTRFNEFWGMTNREILQKVGTDAMRNGFHKDVWIKIAELRLKNILDSGAKVIVTDVRFDNEAELIEKLGGCVIKITRNSISELTEKEKTHASERGIDDKYISFTIKNNMSKDDLKTEFYVKFIEFINRFEDVKIALQSDKSALIENINSFIWKCKKFLRYTPKVFVAAGNGNVRFEWFDSGFDTVIVIITNFEKDTMTFTVSKQGEIIEADELFISKENFDFVNEKIGELWK